MTEADTPDLIVLGAGAAGMAAACTAAALGRRVLLLEHGDRVGGTTAISGGMVWIPANHKMAEAGLPDSPAQARTYLAATVPGADDDRRLATFLARGDEAIRFLEAHTALKFQPVRRYPDYYPEQPGASAGGRVLEPVPFDGRELGPDFARLRDPLPEFMLFGGMMISREDLPVLRRVTRSPAALWHAARLAARYARQRLQAHRGTALYLGNALAARQFASLRQLKVDLRLGARVERLLTQNDRVVGVVLLQSGQPRELKAPLGVVLATGGLSQHKSLRRPYVPDGAGDLSATAATGASLGGARLALDAGAHLSPTGRPLAFWVPASVGPRADGSTAIFPHTVTDRAKPGLIAVNRDGRRFVNEAVSYHEFVRAQLRDAQRNVPAWLVCDSRFLWKYGLGRVRPFALSLRTLQESGYLHSAATLEALAGRIGVPAGAFASTVERFNRDAAQGHDPEFGRGADIYQRHLGDAEQLPNPCVAPILRPPFHAVAVQPADLGMAAGVMTDEHARALRADGTAIDGLYACGNDMHSVMNGAYPGPGITLGPALVFGYLAARHACGEA
ncbi:MAG: FAD-dependent oxidoreductase [Piscinibacter sp.]|uniref:FAD-dependent oxidoreductase n=1 Tax=Piscinibacter TaxID=1114981 RepID=UPI000FDE2A9C|nr:MULTISPECIES: FAD-dependent oxidoreductase [Piscinibacter]MCW5666250.1 FAD-dependent oxidoreductase [Piscinibacter sp.]